MGMIVDNPCCCIPLRKGILVIAIWDIICGAFLFGVTVYVLVVLLFVGEDVKATAENNSTSTLNSTTISDTTTISTIALNSTEVGDNVAPKKDLTFIVCFVFLGMIYSIFQIVFGALLILGLAKEKLLFFKAWLGFRISGVLFTLGTLIAFIHSSLFQGETTQIMSFTIYDGIGLVFSIYFIYVVVVMVMQLKLKLSGPGPVKPFRA